jgi:hypothetical protein
MSPKGREGENAMAKENKTFPRAVSKARKRSEEKSPPYRFNVFQSEAAGMVLVDALLPQWVADRILALVATI